MGQRVLVTAGASGIGREIARAFAAGDAGVFVCDIDAEGLGDLAREVPGLTTGVCDVCRREDVEHMVATGVNALGGLDVFVNNAGISGPTAPVEEVDLRPDAADRQRRARGVLPAFGRNLSIDPEGLVLRREGRTAGS